MAVHIQAHLARCRVQSLNGLDGLLEKRLAKVQPLTVGKYIELLKMKQMFALGLDG